MKLYKKASLLTGGMLMLGAFYGPQASAADFPLGVIAALSSYNTTDTGTASSFTDSWTFQVSGDAVLNDSQSSSGTSGLYSGGVDLTSLQLFDGSTLVATGSISAKLAFEIPTPGIPTDVTSYYASLNNFALMAGESYTLKLSGDYLGTAGGSFQGTLNTTPAAVSSVPLPSAVWFFLSATLGFLGLSRRKTSIG
jgi:hypothetical protein